MKASPEFLRGELSFGAGDQGELEKRGGMRKWRAQTRIAQEIPITPNLAGGRIDLDVDGDPGGTGCQGKSVRGPRFLWPKGIVAVRFCLVSGVHQRAGRRPRASPRFFMRAVASREDRSVRQRTKGPKDEGTMRRKPGLGELPAVAGVIGPAWSRRRPGPSGEKCEASLTDTGPILDWWLTHGQAA